MIKKIRKKIKRILFNMGKMYYSLGNQNVGFIENKYRNSFYKKEVYQLFLLVDIFNEGNVVVQ